VLSLVPLKFDQQLFNTLEVCESSYNTQFQHLNPHPVSLEELLKNDKQVEARNYLELLVELVGVVTVFFRPYIEQYFFAMSSIISFTSSAEVEVRNTALNFLIRLAEAKPTLARKIRNSHSLLKMMTLTENDEWNLGEKHDIKDDQRILGEETLDRSI